MNILHESRWWIVSMFLASFSICIAKSISVASFARVSHNIIGGVRKELYSSVLRKQIGWHDNSENSAGVVTAALASDV